MALTEEERFRFDLTGFLVRPAILTADQVGAMVEHVDKILHDWESLPPEHKGLPSGPCTDLIDHPQVVDVLHDVIGPEIRLDGAFCVWREKGQDGGQPLHQGGRLQADPVFGYRVQEGRIFAGMVRVVFELTDVSRFDGATSFLAGSHKANFPLAAEHMGLSPEERSEFLVSYDCPAGSAIFFTENLAHAGAPWQRDTPRVAVLHAYTNICTRFHRGSLAPEVKAAWTPRQQAYARDPWMYDFGAKPIVANTIDHFLASS
jgi:hypothetical protein